MRFFIDSSCFWAPTWHPLGDLVAPETASKTRKNRPRGVQEPPLEPESRQKRPRYPLDLDFGPFWGRFLYDFEWILIDFFIEYIAYSMIDFWYNSVKRKKKLHFFSTIRLWCWEGCAPPDPPFLMDPFSIALPLSVGHLKP